QDRDRRCCRTQRGDSLARRLARRRAGFLVLHVDGAQGGDKANAGTAVRAHGHAAGDDRAAWLGPFDRELRQQGAEGRLLPPLRMRTRRRAPAGDRADGRSSMRDGAPFAEAENRGPASMLRFSALLAIAVSVLAPSPSRAQATAPLHLQDFLQAVREHNPDIQAARERLQAARTKPAQASAYDDPIV